MTHNPDDDGLAKIGNAYFLVRSPVGGATHAINPKTKKTYCGHDMVKLWNKWRPIDVLPDDKHQPTCKICQRHYDDPVKESLRLVANDLVETIKEYVDTRCILKDSEGLGRLASLVANFVRSDKKRIAAKKKEEHLESR
jgi:hypothetical protein